LCVVAKNKLSPNTKEGSAVEPLPFFCDKVCVNKITFQNFVSSSTLVLVEFEGKCLGRELFQKRSFSRTWATTNYRFSNLAILAILRIKSQKHHVPKTYLVNLAK